MRLTGPSPKGGFRGHLMNPRLSLLQDPKDSGTLAIAKQQVNFVGV